MTSRAERPGSRSAGPSAEAHRRVAQPDVGAAGIDRRAFLERAGAWALGVILASAGPLEGRAMAAEPFRSPPFPRPPVPGACVQPFTPVEKTLAAIVDAVVPGSESDPEGTPGALEGCAMNLIVDDAFPFRSYASLITTLMDGLATKAHGAPFAGLPLEARVDVLTLAQEELPLLKLAYRAIRSAYFGGAYNGVGLSAVGFPGPNLGYRHLPEFSFRKPVCTERTKDGWMP